MKRTPTYAFAAAAVILLGVALYSGAWFADDALRLWRISLNWLRFGSPEFNRGHTAMEFEQPLWVMLLTLGFALGGRLAVTAVVLQCALFCGGTGLLWGCHRLTLGAVRTRAESLRGAAKVVFVALLLAMSNCFREYMTAGLEYSLCYFLVALASFLIARRQARDTGPGRRAGEVAVIVMVGSLLVMTRYDLVWAFVPIGLGLGWRCRAALRSQWYAVALGCGPLALWLVFAQAHFGSVFPDRPERKVLLALPRSAILAHGNLYLLSGLIQEPLTFLLVGLGVVGGLSASWKFKRATLPLLLGLGALTYLGFVVWDGGDSVGSRMLCPAAIMSAAALACAPAFPLRAYAFAACYVAIFFDLGKVSLWRGQASRIPRTVGLFREWGIVDDFGRQNARPRAAFTALKSLRCRDWRLDPSTGSSPPPRLLSSSPGWDGVAAGPGRIVQDWRATGPLRPELSGTVAMNIRFQPNRVGTIEPVLSIGEPAEGTLIMAEHLPRRGLRFQIWKPGDVPIFTRAVPNLDCDNPHRLVVGFGAQAAGRETQGRFRLMMDGVLLEDVQRATRRYSFDEVVAGCNVEGNTSCLPSFSGHIDGLEPARPGEFDHGRWPPTIAQHSLIEARVRFSDLPNSAEPILVTGTEGAGDITFVRRIGPGRVVFGQVHWGLPPELGPEVDVDDSKEHVLKVALGPLFSHSDALMRPDCVQVDMDGQTVLASRQELYPFRPNDVYILDNPLAGSFCGRDFQGAVAGVRTVSLDPLINSVAKILRENSGPISITLRFDGSTRGRGLGLLEIGVPGAGDIVYVIVRDSTHVRFYYDHWGFGGVTGREVEIDPAKAYVLTIEMGSLAAPGDPRPGRSSADRATLDGEVVLEGSLPSAAARNGPIHLMENALVSSNVAQPYDGTCLGVARGGARASLLH